LLPADAIITPCIDDAAAAMPPLPIILPLRRCHAFRCRLMPLIRRRDDIAAFAYAAAASL